MENLVVNYDVFSDKVEKRIVLLTDLHDYPGGRTTSLAKDVKEINPDLIVIAGDILNGPKYKIGNESLKNLKYFLESLSEKSPVYLGLGNHDLFTRGDILEGYYDLSSSKNGGIIPLSNETIEKDDVRIVEFHPRHSAFSPSTQESGRALLEFLEDFEENFPTVDEDGHYNILISHNPKITAQAISFEEQKKLGLSTRDLERLQKVRDILRKFDLILSGHLHNGYRKVTTTVENPKKYMDEGYWEMPMEKDINGRITMLRPWVLKKTDMCRGTIYVGEGEERILELCDKSYFYKQDKTALPLQIEESLALKLIQNKRMIPIVISGGVNRFFNIPMDKSEITSIKVLKR